MGFPVSFGRFEAIPLSRDPARVLIKWDLAPTKVVLTDFEFYVDRGDSQDQIPSFQHVSIDGSPLTPVAPTTDSANSYQIAGPINGLDFTQFVDNSPYLRNLHRLYYYRVRVRKVSTQEEISTPAFTWQGDLDLVGLYIVDEHNFLLEDVTGVPCLVHPRRRGGVSCQRCFDPIQKKRTASHCQLCFGTSWEGGFYKPLDTFVDLNPSPESTTIRDWGESQDNATNVLLSNYPLLQSGDLIRELRENRIWRVVRTQHTEKRRTPMLQMAQVVEVNPGDVEYKLPVDAAFVEAKIAQFEEMRRLREF